MLGEEARSGGVAAAAVSDCATPPWTGSSKNDTTENVAEKLQALSVKEESGQPAGQAQEAAAEPATEQQ